MDGLINDEAAMFQETDEFKKSLSKSNTREISAGIFLIIFFLFYAYLFKDAPILLPIGSILIATGTLYIILYIIRNRMRKDEPPSREETLDYFKYWIGWYQNTYKLQRSVFWWTLLPLIPGLIVFIIGMMQFIMPEITLTILIIFGSSMVLSIGGVVFWLTRHHVQGKGDLQIKINKLNNWISELESKK